MSTNHNNHLSESIMSENPIPQVYQAIAEATGLLAKAGISKDQTNTFDKYKFRSIDDVYAGLAPVLAKVGLTILPRYLERETIERVSKGGGVMLHVTLRVEFDFIAAADGSKHTVMAYGEAMDRADKAVAKAMSAAYKYTCLQTFCIPTEGSGMDADAHSPDMAGNAPKTAHKPPQATITPDQAKDLAEQLNALESDEAAFCTHFRVDHIASLPASALDTALKAIQRKRDMLTRKAAALSDAS